MLVLGWSGARAFGVLSRYPRFLSLTVRTGENFAVVFDTAIDAQTRDAETFGAVDTATGDPAAGALSFASCGTIRTIGTRCTRSTMPTTAADPNFRSEL